LPTAYNRLPTRFEDKRHEAIAEGLRSAGYDVSGTGSPTRPDDLLVTWNLYGSRFQEAESARKTCKAETLVAEEAHIRTIKGEKHFQLAFGGHNGWGRFRVGGHERWDRWEIPISPWQKDGDHILVCAQRGFGYNRMAMPTNWPDTVLAELRERTKMPIWFRAHPKLKEPQKPRGYDRLCDISRPLADDLRNAYACVVYTSGVATLALLAGVPVFYAGPTVLAADACRRGFDDIDQPWMLDRLPALRRLAWSHWSMSEIRSGEAIRWLTGRR
jgi:hypothetical protein